VGLTLEYTFNLRSQTLFFVTLSLEQLLTPLCRSTPEISMCWALCCSGRLASSAQDARSNKFWRALIAEALGTFLLVLVGCGSCIGKDWESFSPTIVQISLTFGLAVATIVWGIAHVSGGHINPVSNYTLVETNPDPVF